MLKLRIYAFFASILFLPKMSAQLLPDFTKALPITEHLRGLDVYAPNMRTLGVFKMFDACEVGSYNVTLYWEFDRLYVVTCGYTHNATRLAFVRGVCGAFGV